MMRAAKPVLTPHDPDFESRVRESFERQGAMKLIGATLEMVAPGEVEIYMPFREDLTQQHGFVHAGIITTIMDNACGFAAYSLMPADASVLSVEFKVNLLAPAKGEAFIARGEVIKPGKTITVCNGEVYAPGEDNKLIATMTATLIMLQGRTGIPQG